MELLLFIIIVLLILLIWFITSTDKDITEKHKELQAEYKNLKSKYEVQKFELKKYQDEEIRKNKELARDFLTDTAFWMRKTFIYAKENKELKKKKKE